MTVAPVTRADVAQFDLGPDQRGLLVTDVSAGGPSWNDLADPDRGGPDIILEVEGKPVKTTAELRDAIEEGHRMKGPVVIDVKVDPEAGHKEASDHAPI